MRRPFELVRGENLEFEMISEEEKDQGSGGSCKTYSRSKSCIERPPRDSSSKSQWNGKARACVPPISIVRPSFQEWPAAGPDDIGVWFNPPTPGARSGSVTPREDSAPDIPAREFECMRDKLAFFNKECSKVLDHIYLGSDAIAKNREILRKNGITHVLNCVGFTCPEYFQNELVYKTLWLHDCPSEDITSILYDVFDYFEDVREEGGRVFVHCSKGVSRSTSLVIAYLMWKEGLNFDDAFQYVKAARGVTEPNLGFTCQLLQCQKRVHALPPSPNSALRMYQMAPHSPYDPLHLVPKMVYEPGADKLDSRGAFIIQIASALYIWIGKYCASLMSDNARAAASQVIHYERANCPITTVKEGEETLEFWDALSFRKKSIGEEGNCVDVLVPTAINQRLDQRKVTEYNKDFEIFLEALSGGVLPPFTLSESGSETCLPSRENGWSRLRIKTASGSVKEFITSSKLNSGALQMHDAPEMMNKVTDHEFTSPENISIPSGGQHDSWDSVPSDVTSSPSWAENDLKEEYPASLSDTSLSRSPSFSLVDSFSSFLVNKSNSSSTSPPISPSTSDYSSSFTFSPSTSNLSNLSFASAQPSLCGHEFNETDPSSSGLLLESFGSPDGSPDLLDNPTLDLPEETALPNFDSRYFLPSLAKYRKSNILSQMSSSCTEETHPSSEYLMRKGTNSEDTHALPEKADSNRVIDKGIITKGCLD